MSLEPSKTLGGIGALLTAIGSFFPPLSFVGIILVLVAMKGLADYYNDEAIFTNALYGFIFAIIGIIVATIVFSANFLAAGLLAISPIFVRGAIQGVAVLLLIFYVLEAILYWRAFAILSQRSGERIFSTAGLILLIGAILTILIIALIISLTLLFVAWILAAIGFFSIKTPTTRLPPPPVAPQPSAVASSEKKYCRYCGAENRAVSGFCEYCGKKLSD